eukprot:3808450-Amphidinium_carterae.2
MVMVRMMWNTYERTCMPMHARGNFCMMIGVAELNVGAEVDVGVDVEGVDVAAVSGSRRPDPPLR